MSRQKYGVIKAAVIAMQDKTVPEIAKATGFKQDSIKSAASDMMIKLPKAAKGRPKGVPAVKYGSVKKTVSAMYHLTCKEIMKATGLKEQSIRNAAKSLGVTLGQGRQV